jgi:hypothetical protein
MAAQLMDLTYPISDAGTSDKTCDADHVLVTAEGSVVLRSLAAVHR